jgi:hypothetical protein
MTIKQHSAPIRVPSTSHANPPTPQDTEKTQKFWREAIFA